jgi:hypothetical protein
MAKITTSTLRDKKQRKELQRGRIISERDY